MTEPLYANLARDIEAAISSGVHRPGTLLPGENTLAEQHRVSRATVRAALDLLEKAGLVDRRRGAGTRVLTPRPPAGFGQSVCTTQELIQYARDTRRVVTSVADFVADTFMANALGLPPGSRWLKISSMRIDPARPRQPICASDSYVAPSLRGITEHLSDETTALFELLSEHFGVRTASIEQELQASSVPENLAGVLAAVPASPALRILRHYRDGSGWLFMTTVGLHPADRFAYRIRLDRSVPADDPMHAARPTSATESTPQPSARTLRRKAR
jgi:DNA-binding GntR family transcriptional regulator